MLVYPEAVLSPGVLNDVRWGWHRGVLRAPYAEIARRLRRPWLADPACYPGDFTRWIRTAPRRLKGGFGERSGWGWGYRLERRYEHVPTELTRLGYVPPHALEARPPRRITGPNTTRRNKATHLEPRHTPGRPQDDTTPDAGPAGPGRTKDRPRHLTIRVNQHANPQATTSDKRVGLDRSTHGLLAWSV